MEILPAIDILGGKVVRLRRGEYDAPTVYSDDPAAVASQFQAAGVGWIHLVDLDAARSGKPVNTQALQSVRKSVGCKLQLGGGARDQRTIQEMLQAGADRVVVGSAALADWDWFMRLIEQKSLAGRIALGLDARDGMLAAQGWTQQSQVRAIELARRVKGSGLGAIVYTDIARDGMLGGVNVPATAEIVAACDVPVIASGGVSSIQDVERCREIGCGGAIIGKAWYEGRIDLSEALAAAAEKTPPARK